MDVSQRQNRRVMEMQRTDLTYIYVRFVRMFLGCAALALSDDGPFDLTLFDNLFRPPEIH